MLLLCAYLASATGAYGGVRGPDAPRASLPRRAPVSITKVASVAAPPSAAPPVDAADASGVPSVEAPVECEWSLVGPDVAAQIVANYFGDTVRDGQQCDVFCIHGVPAATILFTTSNVRGGPDVEKVLLNRALLLLFDAMPTLRRTLYRRYQHINLYGAINHDALLLK